VKNEKVLHGVKEGKTSYMQYNEEKLNELVTYCLDSVTLNSLFKKKKYKDRYKRQEGKEKDVNMYWMTMWEVMEALDRAL